MPKLKLNDVVVYVEKAISDCWESQTAMEPDDQEFGLVDEQIKAYQDVYTFLTGDEFERIAVRDSADDESEPDNEQSTLEEARSSDEEEEDESEDSDA